MPGAESDVPADEHVARSRDTGGSPGEDAPDQGSTTGTTSSEKFVGRVAGQDASFDEETGAEARAEAGHGEGEPTAKCEAGHG